MRDQSAGPVRPQIHLLAAESNRVASLALHVEHHSPLIAAMLLEEIERAELHDPGTLPADAVTIGSEVDFIDTKSGQVRTVQLVFPADANIAAGRISILTPMGAAIYGLMTGQSIDWPDLDGNARKINILRVRQPNAEQRSN